MISVFTKVCKCWVRGREEHWVFSQHLPFAAAAAAAAAAQTIGNCLVLPDPSERKEGKRQGKSHGQSVLS